MPKTRLLAFLAAFAGGFAPLLAFAQPVAAPVYTSGGQPVHGTGIFCLNLDGSACNFGGGAGGNVTVTNAFALEATQLLVQADTAAIRAGLANVVPIAGGNGTTADSAANPFQVQIGDGTNQASVKASGAAAATTDKALVVSQSPNVSTPCSGAPIPINQVTSTDLKTFTNTGHICSFVPISDTAQKVSLVYGTGTLCGTGTVALAGGTTADATHGMSYAANGGVVIVSDRVTMNLGASGQHLCLLQSSTGLIGGFLTTADQ